MSISYTFLMEFYHLLNRGVEKRDIVLDDSDRLRFVHDLFIFNDVDIVDPNHRLRDFHQSASQRRPLISLHAFCLMNNHYHLLVSELVDGGVSEFMRKLNMGYAKYFNERHERSGSLWQGKYRKKLISRDAHFLYIPHYIHLNPLDFNFKEWRDGTVRHVTKALDYLETYRWSSYRDYIGLPNFPSLLDMDPLTEALGSVKRQKRTVAEIISDAELSRESSFIE